MLIGTVFEPFSLDNKSMEFNAEDDEAMGNTPLQTIGIANSWSLMIWFRRRGDTAGLTATGALFACSGGVGSAIVVQSNGDSSGDPMRVLITNSAAGDLKDFRYNNGLEYDVWNQMIVIWDGTDLTLYDNAVVNTATQKFRDFAGTMDDASRFIFFGKNSPGSPTPFSGFLHSAALWNTDITSAVSEIFNGGVATTFDLKAASFASNLQHWWRLGQDSDNFGKDVGVQIDTPVIDAAVNLENMDATDISTESPS